MHKRNWHEYNKRLVQRGSLSFLIDPKVMKTITSKVKKKGKRTPSRVLKSADFASLDDQNSLQNALSNARRIHPFFLSAIQKNESSHLFPNV